MEKEELMCQCHTCGETFLYSNLSINPKNKHISPCCRGSYSVLDRRLDAFFEKYLEINSDLKYYTYD